MKLEAMIGLLTLMHRLPCQQYAKHAYSYIYL